MGAEGRAPLRIALAWAAALGASGFAAGFFGPMILSPESNIGPIVGLLFTGPGGAVAGFVLGMVFAFLPLSGVARSRVLAFLCAVLALGTLYAVLPEPAVRGYVIDARVEACDRPARGIDEAMERWEGALKRVTWAKPPARWKEAAARNVEDDPGVVLTVRIHRKRAILRHRRPWDRGATSAGPWIEVDESKAYYDAREGADCRAYLARPQALYWPHVDSDFDPTKPAREWPPTDTLGFLGLQALDPVPDEYRRLLD
jgi:hypothetical protein